MSRLVRVVVVVSVVAMSFGNATSAAAQSAAEYTHRVDSLARLWRAATATVVKTDASRPNAPSADSLRIGMIIVRTDSEHVDLARAAAARLSPRIERAYGHFAERLTRHQFVLRAKGGTHAATEVQTGLTDSTGAMGQRSSDYANEVSLAATWQRMVEEVMTDAAGPDVRSWIGAIIPSDPPTKTTWSDARIALILAASAGARDCVGGDIIRCEQVLGLVHVDDPAFTFFDASQRFTMIVGFAHILRRADPAQFDRCTVARNQATCDSLAHAIPTDAVNAPIPPLVRQSLVRFALATGGDGAFDRYAAATSPKARLEAASQLPADSLVRRWRDTIMGAQKGSTAVDLETAVSSLAWAALCVACAVRSSRWR